MCPASPSRLRRVQAVPFLNGEVTHPLVVYKQVP
jgi:hypothetical protein